ncbi:PAC2 family protein [Salinirubellus salinus]|jgi:uncharacterized protein|uniref:PAC2 family protein n=1 Tax=Salinirubellus salinus TaxID=1364945 RepID=A0A9E7UCV2_9EURY|nr:PAC2 family protein [Salinirubellus salinus]UWM56284.1 PAC2 family protein [Salinirubellus salinus]
MFGFTDRRPTFDVSSRSSPSETLVVGVSEFGLAGLTAVDYLVTHLGLEETGHIRVDELPTITPFAEGRPRHHTRLYSRDDLDVTVLVGELFLPPSAADAFGQAVIEWTDANGIDETVALSGVPTAHGPDEHVTYHIATDDYRSERLEDLDPAVPAMGGGYLAGVNGALLSHGMETALAACVYTTPVHAQTPDADAALRLLETLDRVYDLGVDLGPLEAFAEQVSRQYEELAARMEAAEAEVGERQAEDRMYM